MEGGAGGDFLVFHDPNDDTMHVHENQLSYDSILSWLESDVDHHHDAAFSTCDPHPDLLLLDGDDEGNFYPLLPFHSTPAITSPPPPLPPSGTPCPYGGGEDCGLFDFEFPVAGGTENGALPDDQLGGEAESAAVDMFLDGEAFLITPAGSPDSFQCHIFSPPSLTAAGETAAGRKRKNRHGGRSGRKAHGKGAKSSSSSSSSAEYDESYREEEYETFDIEEIRGGDGLLGQLNCKNLVSERNRRKRLSQQLLGLRALVPNITKMDKRSVLVDALSYLKRIHEETARIQAEMRRGADTGAVAYERQVVTSAPVGATTAVTAQILEIDVDRMEERRFVLKITSRGSTSSGGKLLKVIESLGFEITFASLEHIRTEYVLTTAFIRVKKHMKITDAKLKQHVSAAMVRAGLTFSRDSEHDGDFDGSPSPARN